jgi:hypothetical protein
VDEDTLARRRSIFFMVFGPLAVAMLVAVYFFVNMEDTAIATVPPPEEVTVYAPLTPTPVPTPLPSAAGPTEVLPTDASAIPHLVSGREDCRSCHGDGSASALPADHQGRANDFCQACHVPVAVPAILHPIEDHEQCLACHGQGQVAEFSLDIHEGRGNADCQACHDLAGVVVSVVQHEVEGHEDCLMCHGPDRFMPYPDSHEGWRNEFCLLCHVAAEAPTDDPHPFPQDHDGANGNCVLCHVDGDLTSYSCETCHPTASMDQVHEPRGISETQSMCMLCHLTGETP